jgi:hypothetical protein
MHTYIHTCIHTCIYIHIQLSVPRAYDSDEEMMSTNYFSDDETLEYDEYAEFNGLEDAYAPFAGSNAFASSYVYAPFTGSNEYVRYGSVYQALHVNTQQTCDDCETYTCTPPLSPIVPRRLDFSSIIV